MNKLGISQSIHQRLLNIRDETGEDFNSPIANRNAGRVYTQFFGERHQRNAMEGVLESQQTSGS
jgi:hypothetical protein